MVDKELKAKIKFNAEKMFADIKSSLSEDEVVTNCFYDNGSIIIESNLGRQIFGIDDYIEVKMKSN